ncbi:iron-siderophore ABC transporter substrate-binding protein [Vibrio profundum]|uniref:iron-siderophore ABC transporter substrate-binding protein n=1 Tax=Vibrio profundum TaxID=2910247 RepID=UPI003D10B2D0
MLKRLSFVLLTLLSSTLFFSMSANAAYTVADSNGSKTLPAVPTRIAVLDWGLAQQVIELGVTPVAMPDIQGYQDWVVKPTVPSGTVDVGTRSEPNYELLAELKPDVILVGSTQQDLAPQLSHIAPVLYYQTYSELHNNVQAAIDNFLQIGHLLGKKNVAQKKLTQMDQKLAKLRSQLDAAYPGKRPKVTAFRFASTTSVYVYGDNSIPQYALQKLGFNNAMPQPTTQWGVTQKRLTSLKDIGHGIGVYFLPFAQQSQLKRSVIWNMMPFVKDGHVASAASTWSYGGALSIQYNAEALAHSLLKLAGKA